MKLFVTLCFSILCFVLCGQSLDTHTFYPSNEKIPATKYQLHATTDGVLTGNERGEVFFFQENGWSQLNFVPDTEVQIKSIFEDSQGRIWIGTLFDGLFLQQGSSWMQYNTQNSDIYSNNVFQVMEDSEGRIWANHGAFGVSILHESAWTSYSADNAPIPDGFVASLSANEEGTVWLGIGKWLVEYQNDEWNWTDIKELTGAEGDLQITNLTWQQGNLLISTTQSLLRLDGNGAFHWLTQNMHKMIFVDAVMDAQGAVWGLEAGFGLHRFKNGDHQSFASDVMDGIPALGLQMELDAQDRLWIANGLGGICQVTEQLSTSVQMPVQQDEWLVFPNPTSGNVNLKHKFNHIHEPFEILVYDTNGSRMATQTNSLELDLSAFSAGVYRIVLRSRQQMLWSGTVFHQP